MDKQPRLPRHVAIIMDGNGRWAKKHAVSVALGHRQGVEALREVIRYSSDKGIQVLSLYAFSTENWSRSKAEVTALMRLIVEYFSSEIDELDEKQVQIRILGDKEALTGGAYEAVVEAEKRTRGNKGLQLNIRSLATDAVGKMIKPEKISGEDIEERLYTKGQPDVDLVIRTSGEKRLSNFLLYQCAYAEMMFVQKLWPDFTSDDFQTALDEYARRDRRFGGRAE
jgi:undecaprenyl diphosphate synthase